MNSRRKRKSRRGRTAVAKSGERAGVEEGEVDEEKGSRPPIEWGVGGLMVIIQCTWIGKGGGSDDGGDGGQAKYEGKMDMEEEYMESKLQE